jgi:hypothetical protein
MQAIQLQPSFGPQNGFTLITLIGSGFTGSTADQLDRFFCSFEDSAGVMLKSTASVLSDSQLSCYTPAQPKAVLTEVGAGVDELVIATSRLRFRYHG